MTNACDDKQGKSMRQFEIVQKIFAFGATYQVFESGSDIAVKTVKGKVLAFTPNLVMVEGDDGDLVNELVHQIAATVSGLVG